MTTRPPQKIRYLTPKRADFLKHFLNFPYISTEQAYKLAGAKNDTQQRATRRFLLKLHEAGYLLRTPLYTQYSPAPHFQFSYRLSKYGAQVVHGKSTAEKSPYSIAHDSEITSFHTELQMEFGGEVLIWEQKNLKKTVYPDALFGFSWDRKRVHYFFLEIEKSRQGHYENGKSGLDTKLERYDKYRKSAKCKKEWVYFDDFRVCVVVKNRERADNLLKKLAGTLPYRFIWITTEEDYKRDIMGSIWRTPKDWQGRSWSFNDVA